MTPYAERAPSSGTAGVLAALLHRTPCRNAGETPAVPEGASVQVGVTKGTVGRIVSLLLVFANQYQVGSVRYRSEATNRQSSC